jgi:peptide/nickel transport system substrate-binding protein
MGGERVMLSAKHVPNAVVRCLLLLVLGAMVVTCGPTPTPVIVEKEKEVEKVVVETKVVEIEVTRPAPKVLVVGHPVEPINLGPFSNTSATYQSVTAATIEQLVYYSPDGAEVEPGLAESWSWSDDGLVLELKLKEGVKFHNGEEFNAEAAKFSIDLLMNSSRYAWMGLAENFDRAEVVDDTTVAVHLSAPAPYVLPGLARGGYVYPPQYYQEVGDEGFAVHPVGTGPYRFVDWIKDARVSFEAFPDYWGGPPKLDGIVWKIIPEHASRVAALEAGEVHLITTITPAAQERIGGIPGLEVLSTPGLRFCGVWLDSRLDHPIADPGVRRAMNYAVDKQGLVALYEGYAAPCNGQMLPAPVMGYNPNVDFFEYDPEKAKELLAEAGYPDGFELPFKYIIDRYPLGTEQAEAIAGYLEAVGITVERIPLEMGEWSRQWRIEDGNTPSQAMGPTNWGCKLHPPEPHMNLVSFRKGGVNARFSSPDRAFDLIEMAALEIDPEKREAMYQEIMQIWNDYPIGIYTIVLPNMYGIREGVTGFVPRVDEVVMLSDVDLEE